MTYNRLEAGVMTISPLAKSDGGGEDVEESEMPSLKRCLVIEG